MSRLPRLRIPLSRLLPWGRGVQASEYDWPELVLGENPADETYISQENVKLLLDQAENALKSQLEGTRQIFSRLGTVLTQASTLASASFGVTYWLFSHPVDDRSFWITLAFITAALFWTLAGVFAVIGMTAIPLGAPGINISDGYKQNILDLDVRRMQLWMIRPTKPPIDLEKETLNV